MGVVRATPWTRGTLASIKACAMQSETSEVENVNRVRKHTKPQGCQAIAVVTGHEEGLRFTPKTL